MRHVGTKRIKGAARLSLDMARAAPRLVALGAILLVVVLCASFFGLAVAQPRLPSLSRPSAPLFLAPSATVNPPAPNPYASGMAASLAAGQPNLLSRGFGHGPQNLSLPYAAALDGSGDLWVVDTSNNRIVEYLAPFATGMSGSLAIGQTNLSGSLSNTTRSGLWEPQGIAFDPSGDLWVADSTNNRILEFEPPFHTGINASLVLGQSSFLTRAAGTSASSLAHPEGLAFNASGDLLVADSGNNRVLEFTPPFSTGMSASLVLGQSTMTASGSGTTASNLSDPSDVAIGPTGAVWVADSGNGRVVEFATPLANGTAATVVLGQANLVSRGQGLPYGMMDPVGIAFDPNGDLWVADASGRNRVTEYLPPLLTGFPPSVVLGQSSFGGSAPGTSPQNLSGPTGVAMGPTGSLWVVDAGNDRVIEFVPPVYSVTVTETGLPSGAAWAIAFAGAVTGAIAPTAIVLVQSNGTFPFAAGAVPGYSASPTSGYVTVNGMPTSLTISYSATSSTSPPPSTVGWLELLVILLALLALLLLALYLRERRRRREPPQRESAAASSGGMETALPAPGAPPTSSQGPPGPPT